MPFSSLCEILIESHLPLISINNFSDKSECIILKNVISKLSGSYPESIEIITEIYRKFTYVSSWHQSEHENIAMWDRYTYGGEGIAIKTNAKRLWHSLRENSESDQYLVKPVKYIKENPSDFEMQEDLLETCANACFFYKKIDYRDESEVRILGSSCSNLWQAVKSNLIDLNTKDYSFLKDISAVDSRPLKCQPSKLIEQIIVSPYAHNQFILTVIKTVGLINICKRQIGEPDIELDIIESNGKSSDGRQICQRLPLL